jgi:hypothetical protein
MAAADRLSAHVLDCFDGGDFIQPRVGANPEPGRVFALYARHSGPCAMSELKPGLWLPPGLGPVGAGPATADLGVFAAGQRGYQRGGERAVQLPDDLSNAQTSS